MKAGDERCNTNLSAMEMSKHLKSAHDVDIEDTVHIEKINAAANAGNIAVGVDNIPVSWFVWLVALTTSMAGGLFGYDTGIISAAELYIGTDLNNRLLTSNEKELITSLCSGGAFVGAIFAGNSADRVRGLIILGSIVMSSCPSWQNPPQTLINSLSSSDGKLPSTWAVLFLLSALFCRPQLTPSLKWPSGASS